MSKTWSNAAKPVTGSRRGALGHVVPGRITQTPGRITHNATPATPPKRTYVQKKAPVTTAPPATTTPATTTTPAAPTPSAPAPSGGGGGGGGSSAFDEYSEEGAGDEAEADEGEGEGEEQADDSVLDEYSEEETDDVEGDSGPETKRLKINGQVCVVTKDGQIPGVTAPRNYQWKQEDGTTGYVHSIFIEMKGPSILKISAVLLKRPATQKINGRDFKRTVSASGVITYEEVPEFVGENTDTLTFNGDRFTAASGQMPFQLLTSFDKLWSTA